jgi:hypothetical protein
VNCELEYQAWVLLDQLDSHPDIEERKGVIVDRTLQRIERASTGRRILSRRVVDLSELLRGARPTGNLTTSPASGVNFA